MNRLSSVIRSLFSGIGFSASYRSTATDRSRGASESAAAMIIAIWLMSVLAMVTGTMALTTLYRQNTSATTSEMYQAEQMVNAGFEAWMGQLRADALVNDVGAEPTEIVNLDPVKNTLGDTPYKLKINEIKSKLPSSSDYTCDVNPGVHVELVNTSDRVIDITGFYGVETQSGKVLGPTVKETSSNYQHLDQIGVSDHTPNRVYLCPLDDEDCARKDPAFKRFFSIGTPNFNVGADTHAVRICRRGTDPNVCQSTDLADTRVIDLAIFDSSCEGPDDECGLTWQVYPDGTHGQFPTWDRDLTDGASDPVSGYISHWSKAPCTMDPTVNNGDTVVRRYTNNKYDIPPGKQVTQENGDGQWLVRGDWGDQSLRFVQNPHGDSHVFEIQDAIDVEFMDYFKNSDNHIGKSVGSPYCEKIKDDCSTETCRNSCNYQDKYFINTTASTGTAIITNALMRHRMDSSGTIHPRIEAIYPNADTT
ncbi:MAG: hypothetical protein ABEK50_02345, partial [bacterium]